jgi:hypothetical protein
VLRGTKPFIAAQYSSGGTYDSSLTLPESYGDPSYVLPPPTDAFSTCHLFYAGPDRVSEDIHHRQQLFPWDSLFVSIVAWAGEENQVRLDGASISAAFERIPGSPFAFASIPIQKGTHFLSTTDPHGVYGMHYAFAEADAYSAITSRTFQPADPPLRIQHTDASAAAHTLHVNPNPVRQSGLVEFKVTSSGVVRIECIDALGRTRLLVCDRFRIAGRHRVGFDAGVLNPGRYWLRMTAGGRSMTKALEVLR